MKLDKYRTPLKFNMIGLVNMIGVTLFKYFLSWDLPRIKKAVGAAENLNAESKADRQEILDSNQIMESCKLSEMPMAASSKRIKFIRKGIQEDRLCGTRKMKL